MSNQSDRQAAVRGQTGTTLDYNSDWLKLMADAGFTTGTFNERLYRYLSEQTGLTGVSLDGLKAQFAKDQGANDWNSLGDISFIENLVVNPNDMTLSPWVNTAATSVDNSVLTPSGDPSSLVNDNSAAGNLNRAQVITIPNDSVTRRFSIDVKANTSDIVMIGIQHSGGSTPSIGFTFFDLSDGSKLDRASLEPAASGQTALTDGYRRIWLEMPNNSSGHTSAIVYLYPAPRADLLGSTLVAATVGSVNATNAQFYE